MSTLFSLFKFYHRDLDAVLIEGEDEPQLLLTQILFTLSFLVQLERVPQFVISHRVVVL